MINPRNLFRPLAVAALLALTGCASHAPTVAQVKPTTVPSLKITLDCGSCQVRPEVQPLMQQAYAAAAARDGISVSPDAEALVAIKQYTARDTTARVLAGALAGKDEMLVEVKYQGKTYTVTDYFRNAWQGIESLSKKMGELIYSQIQPI